MEIKDILTLIDAVSKSRLSSFSYEEGETKLTFEAKCEGITSVIQKQEDSLEHGVNKAFDAVEINCNFITSPMVGTFYSAGVEDGEPFITVGDTVKRGQVIGIVEAMKLMNEIESQYEGVIEEILVNNKDMIGFGQQLIKIRPF